MLTAQTKTGKKICLGYNYKKETLLYLRNKEEFVCPVCGENVTLKLGEMRIFHFAHSKGTNCRATFESESVYHMEGKRQLYQWLLQQKIPSELEYYDKEIQQRPDIMFLYNGKKIALEYQCSPISEKIFIKRTESYKQHGYIPIWILGNKQVHQKKKEIVSLSNFHYLFIRGTPEGNHYLPTYCPDKKQFHLLESIHSYSAKNAFVEKVFFRTNQLTVDRLFAHKPLHSLNFEHWYQELDFSFFNRSLHPSPHQYSFLHELYQYSLNPYLLPPEIGLPIQLSILIQTSPIIWQTYFYLDHLRGRNPGDGFSLLEIERCLLERIARKEIIPRKLPQFQEKNPLHCILDYLEQLINLGFITHINMNDFQVVRSFQFPKNNREKEELRKKFFEKYHSVLQKNK